MTWMPKFRFVFLGACVFAAGLTLVLVFVSERGLDANVISPSETQSNASSQYEAILSDDLAYLDGIRSAYSQVATIEMEAQVSMRALRDGQWYSGTATISYSADGEKYFYESVLSDELLKAGFVSNLKFAWNGSRYFMLDTDSDVLSFQRSEPQSLPSSIPNPFFLPLEFMSSESDACAHCRLRLRDLASPEAWPERRSGARMVQSEQQEGFSHSLLTINGGKRSGQHFDYLVRLVGHSGGERQINSISLNSKTGRILGELVFGKFSTIRGIGFKVPLETKFAVHSESGKPEVIADFQITKLVLNETVDSRKFDIGFNESGKVWDSDTRQFVKH